MNCFVFTVAARTSTYWHSGWERNLQHYKTENKRCFLQKHCQERLPPVLQRYLWHSPCLPLLVKLLSSFWFIRNYIIVVRSVSISTLSRLQAKAKGGRISTSSWRVTMHSSFISKVRREPPNPKGWSTSVCAPCIVCTTVCLAGGVSKVGSEVYSVLIYFIFVCDLSFMDTTNVKPVYFFFLRSNCFQLVVQHFSEEQYIFYFAGEAQEQAQVIKDFTLSCQWTSSNNIESTCPDGQA